MKTEKGKKPKTEKTKKKKETKEKKKEKRKRRGEPIRARANPNAKADGGDTPFHKIARRGIFEEILALLMHPIIDITIENERGELPLACIPYFATFEKKVVLFLFFLFCFSFLFKEYLS